MLRRKVTKSWSRDDDRIIEFEGETPGLTFEVMHYAGSKGVAIRHNRSGLHVWTFPDVRKPMTILRLADHHLRRYPWNRDAIELQRDERVVQATLRQFSECLRVDDRPGRREVVPVCSPPKQKRRRRQEQ